MKLVIFEGDNAGYVSTEFKEEVKETIKNLIKDGEIKTMVSYDEDNSDYEEQENYEVRIYHYDENLQEGIDFLLDVLYRHNYIGGGHDTIGIVFTDDDGCYLTSN